MGQEILEQIERRRVEPLKSSRNERQRMLRPRKNADETPECELKPPLRLLWLKLGNWRLLANEERQFGD